MARSPGDFTGKQKARLQKEEQEEQQRQAEQMTMITAAEKQRDLTEVVDYTERRAPEPEVVGPVDYSEGGDHAAGLEDSEDPEEVIDTTVPEEVVSKRVPVEAKPEVVLVRARYNLPQVTIGKGNHYDFEAGRQYKVPYNVAEHLAEREYVDVLQRV